MRLREFFFGSLRRQLIFSVAAVHAVMMSLFIWDLTERQQDLLLDRQAEQAQALAQTLATSAAGWLAARDISGLQELVEAQRRYPQLAFAMLLDREGRVLAHTEHARQGQYVRDLPREAKLTLLARDPTLVDAIAPAMLAGHAVGWARVGIGQQEAREKLDAITRNGVFYALAAIVIGSILALLMGNRMTRKLYALRRVSETVRAGHQEVRVPDLGGDEVGQLARDFNVMLDAQSSSEKSLTNIIALAADAIISVDEDQRILIFNQGAERIFGYTAAEILGQPLDKLLPARVAAVHREHVRRFAAEPDAAREMNRRMGIHGRRKDGTEFPAEASISKVKQNGNFQFTVFLRDISERKKAEDALRESEQRLRIIIETEPECVKVVSPRGNLLEMNAAGLAMLEVESLGEAQHGLLMDFILPEYHDAFRALHSRVMQGESGTLEFEVLGLRGTRRWLETHAAPMRDAANKVVSLLGITRDITERKRAEEEIRQLNVNLERHVLERTAELAAANQELEAFSYSVSHDLRAPLRSIDGFSQAVLEDYADRLDDQGREHLNRVRAATQHMGHLIDDLIKLARVTRAEMHRESVDLSALAGDVLAELRKREPDRRVEHPIEPNLVAEGDARLLRVVLDNLLGNAWKFTGKQAHARIEFGALPQASPGMDEVDRVGNRRSETDGPAYFVRDNGAGFDMTYAGKLFGAFQRLHTAHEFPGTGVGLATVQRIVHRHGGRVWAEGAVGKGATFYFTL